MTIALKGLIKLLTECLLEVFVTRELHTAGEAYQKVTMDSNGFHTGV